MRFFFSRSARWCWRAIFISFLIVSFLAAARLLVKPSQGSREMHETEIARPILRERLQNRDQSAAANQRLTKKGCIPPKLDPFHESITPFLTKEGPVSCSKSKDWVYVSNGTFRISQEAQSTYGNIVCEYTPLIRKTDFAVGEGPVVKPMLDGAALTSDFFKVNCVSGGGQRYSNVHSGVAANPDIHKRLEEHASAARDEERRRDPSVTSQGLGLSVFMFGFDSTSRMSWIRNLPRTREYFLNNLGGIELEGYNIVGDGTPAALLPILTGKVEEELPEARRGHAGAKQLDGHPWVWKDFKRHGYVTAHAEDMAHIGTFQLRMLGFQDSPTDHSMRPFYQTVEPTYKNQEPLCLGSTPRHVNFLNWFRDLFDMYHKYPKMFFGFHSEFSHGSGCKLQAMDDDLLSFLKNLEKKGYLNSTLLILMADHGARFHDLRVTKQGNLEERMPYFSFRFPPWFRKQHPDIVRNVEINSHRLTTPFDIHATFMDILDYKGPGVANISQRGVSLFREIPEKRTCSDAYIAPHWCACLDWQDVDQQDANVQKAVKTAVDTINSYTASSRRSCAELRLDEITSSAKYITSTNDYKTEKIMRNYLANDQAQKDVLQSYVSTLKGNAELYQVSFITQPGHGQFEVTCVRDVTSDTFTVSSNAISRLNKYGSAPACIEKRFPHLRPYCYCS